MACVQINEHLTDWFPTPCGVKQGDILSPTLFAVFINDLVSEVKEANVGAKIGDSKVCILVYADDIVFISDNEMDLQLMLNITYKWCCKMRLRINSDKTQVMHCRKQTYPLTGFQFSFGHTNWSLTSTYKSLGFILDEHLTYDAGITALSQSAGRALGAVIKKVKAC